ncbi:hypothetical protein [Pseudomonas syringae]|uniref:hypothetical protein n=1 Tax=Pseudomonas syringae TaxID=317 RepID=UPI0018640B7F
MGRHIADLVAQLLKVFAHPLYDLIVTHTHLLSKCRFVRYVHTFAWSSLNLKRCRSCPLLNTGCLKLVDESGSRNDYGDQPTSRHKWIKACFALELIGLRNHFSRLSHKLVNLSLEFLKLKLVSLIRHPTSCQTLDCISQAAFMKRIRFTSALQMLEKATAYVIPALQSRQQKRMSESPSQNTCSLHSLFCDSGKHLAIAQCRAKSKNRS